MGGLLALTVASKNPRDVSKIVPINAAGIRVKKPIFVLAILAVYDLLVKVNSIKGLKRAIKLLKAFITFSLFKLFDKRAWQLLLSIIKTDYENRIKKIRIPTTIIWAKSDLLLPVSNAYKIKELIPNSKLVLVENEHHPWVELNQELVYKTLIKNI